MTLVTQGLNCARRCVISGFHRLENEIYGLLRCYAA